MAATTTEPTVKRHPIRGFVWGALLGLGFAFILADRAVIALGTLTPVLIVVLMAVLTTLWGLFGPPKRDKSLASAAAEGTVAALPADAGPAPPVAPPPSPPTPPVAPPVGTPAAPTASDGAGEGATDAQATGGAAPDVTDT